MDEHKPRRCQHGLRFTPFLMRCGHIRAIMLGGAQLFFEADPTAEKETM
jgi:hypothetical protein